MKDKGLSFLLYKKSLYKLLWKKDEQSNRGESKGYEHAIPRRENPNSKYRKNCLPCLLTRGIPIKETMR